MTSPRRRRDEPAAASTAPRAWLSAQRPSARPPVQARAVSPMVGTRMTAVMAPPAAATQRPQGRSTAKTPNTTPSCCRKPITRSVANVVPNTLNTPARTHRLPGPYRCRKSRLGISPWSTSSGKTSMKPSSMGGPGARHSSISGSTQASTTTPSGSTQGRAQRRFGDGSAGGTCGTSCVTVLPATSSTGWAG